MTTRRFYDTIRPLFGDVMTQEQVDGIDTIVAACKTVRTNRQAAAYILATAMHETGGKMTPVEENLNYSADRILAVWPSRFDRALAETCARNPQNLANHAYANRMGNGDPSTGDGWRYRGRGFVQITGRENYRRLGLMIRRPLEERPDLACEVGLAAQILVQGMMAGAFTGVSLDDVSEPATSAPTFENDRRVVNGRDRADLIARKAEVFYEALADVDLLEKSRTIKAAKATKTSSNLATAATVVTGGVGASVKAFSEDPQKIVDIAKQGVNLGEILNWGNAGWVIASLLVVVVVYQRGQAMRIEAARREDNEQLGV